MRLKVAVMVHILAITGMAGIANQAWAVGDPPVQLDRLEATRYYASVRPFLENDGRVCPDGQMPVSGMITGGAAPSFGSQTILLRFNKGSIVKITKSWDREPGKVPTSSVAISCS